MKTKASLIALVILVLAGCIPSVYPLYTKKDLIFEQQLLGNWVDTDGDDTWVFKKGHSEKSYSLIQTDDDGQAEFSVHLVKLGDHYFLDFYPEENLSCKKTNELYGFHVMPVHTFAKVKFINGKVEIHYFDVDWLDELFKQRKIRIKHEMVEEDTYLLTAPTEELQKFVIKYAKEESAYIDPIILAKE